MNHLQKALALRKKALFSSAMHPATDVNFYQIPKITLTAPDSH